MALAALRKQRRERRKSKQRPSARAKAMSRHYLSEMTVGGRSIRFCRPADFNFSCIDAVSATSRATHEEHPQPIRTNRSAVRTLATMMCVIPVAR